jgi:hypothetical protein
MGIPPWVMMPGQNSGQLALFLENYDHILQDKNKIKAGLVKNPEIKTVAGQKEKAGIVSFRNFAD